MEWKKGGDSQDERLRAKWARRRSLTREAERGPGRNLSPTRRRVCQLSAQRNTVGRRDCKRNKAETVSDRCSALCDPRPGTDMLTLNLRMQTPLWTIPLKNEISKNEHSWTHPHESNPETQTGDGAAGICLDSSQAP